MFSYHDKKNVLLTNECRTYAPVKPTDHVNPYVLIPGLSTCAALIVSYKSKSENSIKIFAAHVPSGITSAKMDKELVAIKADAEPSSITSIYWAGAENLDRGYIEDIASINEKLAAKTITRVDAGNIRIDLATMTVLSTNDPNNTLSLNNPSSPPTTDALKKSR